jgi:hypothetical protein
MIGDGNIFLLSVEEAVRIRTGETGETALSPPPSTPEEPSRNGPPAFFVAKERKSVSLILHFCNLYSCYYLFCNCHIWIPRRVLIVNKLVLLVIFFISRLGTLLAYAKDKRWRPGKPAPVPHQENKGGIR